MTWIESVARQLGLPARANRAARRRHLAGLGLTRLEDRAVPATLTWTGGGGDNLWSTAANWGGSIAAPGDDLVFADLGGPVTAVNDFAAGTNFSSIRIEGAGYAITGNAVDLTGDVETTYGTGSATLGIDAVLGGGDVVVAAGGTLEFGGAISGAVGLTVSGGGTLRLSGGVGNTYTGGTTLIAGTLELGKSSAVAVPSGTLVVGDASGTDVVRLLASDQIADGTAVSVVGAAATLDLNGFNDSIGALSVTGSTVQTGAGTLTLGGNITSNGSSTQALISGNVDLGGSTRTVSVNSGSPDPDLRITANISGTGAGLTLVGGITGVELSGNNTYDGLTTISSGSVRAASANALGSPAVGTLVSSGATLALTSNTTITGETLTISGNGVAGVLGALSVFIPGETNTYAGNIILAGNSLISTGSATLVLSGEISESGGARSLTVSGSIGRVILSGANSFTGGMSVAAGYLRAAHANALGDPTASTTATFANTASLELSGGITLPATKSITLQLNGVSNTEPKVISADGNNTILGTLTFAGNEELEVAAGSTLTLAGTVAETGGNRNLIKSGAGTLALTGTDSYTGTTFIGAGTLLANSSIASSTAVTMFGAATLGGSGTLPAFTLASGGTLAPGNSPGVLSSGNAGFVSGSTYSVELNGATAGTQHDQLDVTGTVTLGGATLAVSLGYSPALGTAYTIIDNDGSDAVSGTFSGLAEGGTFTAGAATFTVSYAGGDGNDVVLTVSALTYIWDGEGSDRDWTNGVNWVGDVAPTAGASLVFAAGAVTSESTNDFASGTVFSSITVASSGYDIYGNALDLTNGVTTTYTSGNSAIDLGIALAAGKTFDIAGGGTLTYTGTLSGGFGVTKTGAGTLALSGTNTYTGVTLVTAGTLAANSLGGTSGLTLDGGTLTAVSSPLSVGVELTIGSGGATVNLSNGSIFLGAISGSAGLTVNSSSGGNVLSAATNSAGTFSGSTTLNNGILEFGDNSSYGVGTIIINGGKVRAQGGTPRLIGNPLSLGGTLTMSGSAALTFMGPVDLTGGTRTINDSISSDLTFTGMIHNGDLTVNSQGSGAVVLGWTNTYGTTTVTAGTLSVAGDDNLGSGAVAINGGTLLVMGSGVTIDNDFDIGGNATVSNANALTLSGALSGGAFTLTKSGTGKLTLTNAANEAGWTGGLTAQGNIEVPSDEALPAGTVTLSGGWLYVNGTTTIDNAIVLGSGTNVIDVASGQVATLNGSMSGTGTQNLNKSGGGTLVLAGTASHTGNTVLNGGTLSVGSDAAVGDGQIIVNNSSPTLEISGPLSRDINVNHAGTIRNAVAATLSGVLSGTGALTKTGAGVLTLSGANTHSGMATISAGALIVNGSLASSSVTVGSGGTLGGGGTVAGAASVQSGGLVAPGNSPGTLTFGNGLTFASGSAYSVELDGTTAGTHYDQADVIGTVTLSDATLNLSVGFAPAAGDTFTIIDNDGSDAITGTFSGLAEGALVTVGPTTLRVSYVGGSGNDVTLTAVATPTVSGAASANPAVFGQAVTVTATVTGAGTPTGNVTLVIDGVNVETVALVGGVATFAPISHLSVGSHTVSFEYAGDASHLPSIGTLSGGQVVGKAATTATVVSSANPTTVGHSVTFTATVTSIAGTPTGTVTFVNGTTGQALGTAVLSGGVARFTTNKLAVGVVRIEIAYAGDGDHTGRSAFVSQTIDPLPVPPVPGSGSAPPAVVSVSTGSGPGGTVRLFDLATGASTTDFQTYPGYSGEIRVATGDVTGDGVADAITAVGAGPTGGHVKVFDGATGELRSSFYAFPGFSGGVFVTSGDVNADGHADIIAAAGPGGGPHVKVFSGADGSVLFSFMAYDPAFAGGVHVAAGDVDGDGKADIVTGAGAGGAPHVKAFSGKDLSVLRSFLAYSSGFTGGVYVGVGDFDVDGKADIVTGAGAGGTPYVKVFGGADQAELASFLAFAPDFRGGVRVGSTVIDGTRAVLAGAGPAGGPHVKAFGLDGGVLRSFYAGEAGFSGGVYVG